MSSDESKPTESTFTEARPEQPTHPDTPAAKSLPPEPAEPKYRILTAWVQGGTTTSAHDKAMQKFHADAEARRRQHDAEHALASRPIERGGAQMHSANFTAPTDPRILLRYINSKKETELEILCELPRDDMTGKRMLIICCPECVKRGVPAELSQFTVREEQRKWHVDERTAGKMLSYVDTDYHSGRKYKQIYMSAGVVMDSEIFRCPHHNCGVRYQIDNNMLRRV